MSVAAPTSPTADAPVATAARGESLATGVVLMLVLNVVQRGVGFVRGLLFCRFLGDAALGQFSLANSFLLLAAPLVVLGLPGSFGRYIEYYRQRGQLQAYLRKLTFATALLTGLGVLLMTALAKPLSYWVFDTTDQYRLMMYSVATLGIVVAFNFINELLTALRLVRAVSWMQFANSIAFTVAGLGLLVCWENSAEAIMVGYAISCLVALIAVAPWFGELRAAYQQDAQPLATGDAWAKLLPFAWWIWLTNLVVNLSDMVDRLMILHVGGFDIHTAQAIVGQYHSSRVVPVLIATLGATFATIVLPHWSHDWERGLRSRVSQQLSLTTKLLMLLLAAGSLLVLAASPLLFDWLLAGKYSDGLAALPWALVGAIWFVGFVIAQNYLLCAEKAKLVTAASLLGVVANVALNLIALPWGLPAIMAARALATLATVAVVFACAYRDGLKPSLGLMITFAAPLVVLLGAPLGAVVLLGLLVLDWRGRWLFTEEEEQQLVGLVRRLWQRITERFLTV